MLPLCGNCRDCEAAISHMAECAVFHRYVTCILDMAPDPALHTPARAPYMDQLLPTEDSDRMSLAPPWAQGFRPRHLRPRLPHHCWQWAGNPGRPLNARSLQVCVVMPSRPFAKVQKARPRPLAVAINETLALEQKPPNAAHNAVDQKRGETADAQETPASTVFQLSEILQAPTRQCLCWALC